MAKEKEALIDFSALTKEQAIEEIKNRGFAKIQKMDIKNFLDKFEAGKSREWLKEAYKPYIKSKLVEKKDENGNVVFTDKKDKDGNPIPKKIRVKDEESKVEKKYNHNTAKTLFFKRLGLETKIEKAIANWEDEFNSFWN